MEINVFKHKLWGRIGKSVLIETQVFEFGALEFGEELLMQKHFHEDWWISRKIDVKLEREKNWIGQQDGFHEG